MKRKYDRIKSEGEKENKIQLAKAIIAGAIVGLSIVFLL